MHRNLVIVRAGDTSMHRSWLDGVRAGTYDLIVSYFGDEHHRYDLPEENTVYFKGGKWDGIHAVFRARPELLSRYDYFWFPDDDIIASSEDVSRLFLSAARERLDVCQPALSHDSYYSHMIYLQCPSFRLRYANAIEIMVPCLSRSVLELVLPLFSHTRSGFGMDGLWTRVMQENHFKAAILDEVAVRHCRPVGGDLHKALESFGDISANDEREAVYQALGQNLDGILVYAGVLAGGRIIQNRAALLYFIMSDLLRVKRTATRHKFWPQEMARLVMRQITKRLSLSQLIVPRLQNASDERD